MEQSLWITAGDGTPIFLKKWFSDKQPKALVQLSHGMAEHIGRYDEFAKFLVEKGIFVYGNDHRGHGQSGLKQGLLGYFSDNGGYRKAVDDLYQITKMMKEDYPNTPIFLFGHSMGSFLARCFIQKYSRDIHGVILSGTGYFTSLLSAIGKTISTGLEQRKPAPVMIKLAFGTYNRKISRPKTAFDWLSRDEKEVQKFVEDPLCGFIPTASFFVDLMSSIQQMQHPRLNEAIRKDLPIFFVSGDQDPVGNYAKGIWKSAELYENLGLYNISILLFHEARHETLHEVNKEEAFALIHKWLIKQL